ncbi:MAG: anti-sigma factor [Actinobacteria bacterium]|nr:MAG: anti-sigma factor [Actinomycetota bacterium]
MNDGSPHELSAAYALDALDGDELEAYETHLAGCERCREEVASFRETASTLAYDVDLRAPPETLEHRILAAARAERPNVVPLRQRVAIPAAALSAAAAVAAIALGIWAVHLSNSLDRQKSIRKDQKALIDILSDCSKTPTSGSSGAVCVAPTEKAVLIADSLPAASPDKTYEAWVIVGNSVQPAGLFRGGAGRKYILLTEPVRAPAKVAVTLEKRGGVPAPTSAILLQAQVRPS